MLDFACGELELREATFWDMTFREYERRARGYGIKEQKQRHHIRRVIHSIISPHLRKGRRLSLKDIDRLPLFDIEGSERFTDKDKKRHLRIIEKLKNN